MTIDVDIRAAAAPRSNQLNAEDLIGTTKTITVTEVKANSAEQPIAVHYESDGGKPFLPCKTNLRVLISAWGDRGADWAGKSMTLYADPDVQFGGVKVGGIRISHVSHIDNAMVLNLSTSRGKRKPVKIEPLRVPETKPYPDDLFAERLPAMRGYIESGKATVEQVIEQASKTGTLSETQIAAIRAVQAEEEA
jgi:hypothetical protein